MKDAVSSYNNRYGGHAITEGEHEENQFRVIVDYPAETNRKQSLIDLDFIGDRIRVVCRTGYCNSVVILLNPDETHPYRPEGGSALTLEQVSNLILATAFFPAPSVKITVVR
jgi:hypothetical protein